MAEVRTKNYCRLSINGWFHTDKPPVYEQPTYLPPATGIFSTVALPPQTVEIDIETWLTGRYLEANTVEEIQEQIEECSEISLQEFLIPERYKQVVDALNLEELRWTSSGPPNRRNYEILIEENLPDVLKEFLDLFKSREMFALLEGYTELELASKKGSMRYEVQRWRRGSYSVSFFFSFL